MPDPNTLEGLRTGTPDATNGHKLGAIAAQEDSTEKLPAGVAMSDVIGNAPAAHRSALSAVDTATDMSPSGFGTSTLKTGNRGAIVVWCEFANAAGSAVVRLVFYDDSGTLVPLFLGPALTFTADTKRVSASGDYLSEAQLVDSGSALAAGLRGGLFRRSC